MTDTLSTDDIEAQTAKRDDNGNLLGVEKEIDWPGAGKKTVRVRPVTTGVINQLSQYEDEIEQLKPRAIKAVVDAYYLEPDPSEFDEQTIEDLRAPALNALIAPFLEELDDFDVDDPRGNGQLHATTQR